MKTGKTDINYILTVYNFSVCGEISRRCQWQYSRRFPRVFLRTGRGGVPRVLIPHTGHGRGQRCDVTLSVSTDILSAPCTVINITHCDVTVMLMCHSITPSPPPPPPPILLDRGTVGHTRCHQHHSHCQ